MRVVTDKSRKASAQNAKLSATPEFREAAAKRMTELWANPEYREQQTKRRLKRDYPAVQPDDAVKLPPDTLDL